MLQLAAAQAMILDASQGETFDISFRTSITSIAIKNLIAGQLYCFILRQDATGKHALNWGNNFLNAMMLDPNPNSVTVQCFIGVPGQVLMAITPGTWTEEGS